MTPRDAGDLERLLEGVRFEPRASLGPEVVGRWRRGEQPAPPPRPRWRVAAAGAAVGMAALALWAGRSAPQVMVVDRCCQDLDGGGAADDGLVVESLDGTRVRRLAIYEDNDRTGGFSAGDTVRFERAGSPALGRPRASVEAMREFCCLDYDGGGDRDDALVVVGVAPDLITMAAIYEVPAPPGHRLRFR